MNIDQQFIEYIVKSLVNHPDAVKIDRRIDEKGVLLELTVDPEDLGRVIGKRGATAQSLRTLLRALGTKNDARYNLKIIDNGEPRPPRDDSAAPAVSADEPTADTHAGTDDAPIEPAEVEEPAAGEPTETSKGSLAGEPEDVARATDDDTLDRRPEALAPGTSLADRTRAELADLDDLDL